MIRSAALKKVEELLTKAEQEIDALYAGSTVDAEARINLAKAYIRLAQELRA